MNWNGKWPLKRVGLLVLSAVLFGFLFRQTYREITEKSDFSSIVIYSVCALFVFAVCLPVSRRFLFDHPKAVRVSGWCVIAVGIFGMVASLLYAVQDGVATTERRGSDWTGFIPIMALIGGILILRIPGLVQKKRE